jgi:hypothetical protein
LWEIQARKRPAHPAIFNSISQPFMCPLDQTQTKRPKLPE